MAADLGLSVRETPIGFCGYRHFHDPPELQLRIAGLLNTIPLQLPPGGRLMLSGRARREGIAVEPRDAVLPHYEALHTCRFFPDMLVWISR